MSPDWQESDTRLWLPGVHAADARVRAVARAVERYDEAFRFAKHELTGDWVVTIGDQGHPVFGFGKELPAPDDVERLLSEKDIGRHSAKILRELHRDAEAKHIEARHAMDDHNGQLAEKFEHLFRREGRHPSPRIFVPKGI